MTTSADYGKCSFPFAREDEPREDDDEVTFDPIEKRKRRQFHARPLPPSVKFATPQMIAELTNATPSGRRWSGHCPCHDDRTPSLTISWGRKRNTVVHCHAGCPQESLIEHFRSQGWCLYPVAAAKPGATPGAMLRALRLCSTSEWRIYHALQARGDGPATYGELAPYTGHNRNTVARALRGLEFLGLLQIRRGRPYWEDERQINPANIYAVATKRLFRWLDATDDAVRDGLCKARKSEADAAALHAQPDDGGETIATVHNGHGSIGFDTASYVDGRDGGWAGGDSASRPVGGPGAAGRAAGEAGPGPGAGGGPPLSGPQRGKPARAVRAFAAACAALASDGPWEGSAHDLLRSLSRPVGERSWPRTSHSVQNWLWMARFEMKALGCVWDRKWRDTPPARVGPPLSLIVLTVEAGAAVSGLDVACPGLPQQTSPPPDLSQRGRRGSAKRWEGHQKQWLVYGLPKSTYYRRRRAGTLPALASPVPGGGDGETAATSDESALVGCLPASIGLMVPRPVCDGYGRVPLDQRWTLRMRAFVAALRALSVRVGA